MATCIDKVGVHGQYPWKLQWLCNFYPVMELSWQLFKTSVLKYGMLHSDAYNVVCVSLALSVSQY